MIYVILFLLMISTAHADTTMFNLNVNGKICPATLQYDCGNEPQPTPTILIRPTPTATRIQTADCPVGTIPLTSVFPQDRSRFGLLNQQVKAGESKLYCLQLNTLPSIENLLAIDIRQEEWNIAQCGSYKTTAWLAGHEGSYSYTQGVWNTFSYKPPVPVTKFSNIIVKVDGLDTMTCSDKVGRFAISWKGYYKSVR